ncbi:MAG: alpha/beta fold hydrolase [Rhodoferax sp.]|uniref:alpha/beta hydrolase n=1 Tax=Rhodoferax sp. TaxID=50421 RepID=UPI00261E8690|nr:alpha/beta fold hydrolase [Rhodoferax sp.]MDD5335865.1 alpha/beta fold hydrolase [Rhodoferax sp.]
MNAATSSTSPMPPPGRRFDVGGLRLHLQRSAAPAAGPGAGRRPTIVIEAGLGCASPIYARLQRALSGQFDVCSYDRAGLGWSDPAPAPADAVTAAGRLQGLLAAAGVAGPLLLVGHSLGALIVRVFAKRYPQQVAGVVLLDGSHPEQRLEPALSSPPPGFEAHLRGALHRYQTGGEVPGELALLMQIFSDLPEVPAQLAALARESMVDATMLEWQSFAASAQQAEQAGDLGDLPLTVLWAPVVAAIPGMDAAQLLERWRRFQSDAATLSSRSRLLAVDGADHMGLVLHPQFAAVAAREIAALAHQVSGAR